MTRLTLTALACLLAPWGARADEKADAKLLETLQGSYSLVSAKRAGLPPEDKQLEKLRVVIAKEVLTLTTPGEGGKDDVRKGTIVLDTEQKPVAIDLTAAEGPDAGKPFLGVVEVRGDEVIIAWAPGFDADRPKDFTSTKENKSYVLVLKRLKK